MFEMMMWVRSLIMLSYKRTVITGGKMAFVRILHDMCWRLLLERDWKLIRRLICMSCYIPLNHSVYVSMHLWSCYYCMHEPWARRSLWGEWICFLAATGPKKTWVLLLQEIPMVTASTHTYRQTSARSFSSVLWPAPRLVMIVRILHHNISGAKKHKDADTGSL